MALIRQWRLSTFRQRGTDWWRRDIHMPDPASGQQLPGYDFSLEELEDPETHRKLHTPDMTLAKNKLARGARLPHPGSWCESRRFPPAPSQTVPLWAIELTQPQFPQEYCQCFPACLYPKYFQFTQDINRHCCRRTLVQLYVRDIWLNYKFIALNRYFFKDKSLKVNNPIYTVLGLHSFEHLQWYKHLESRTDCKDLNLLYC